MFRKLLVCKYMQKVALHSSVCTPRVKRRLLLSLWSADTDLLTIPSLHASWQSSLGLKIIYWMYDKCTLIFYVKITALRSFHMLLYIQQAFCCLCTSNYLKCVPFWLRQRDL